jgi:hypothetical protein
VENAGILWQNAARNAQNEGGAVRRQNAAVNACAWLEAIAEKKKLKAKPEWNKRNGVGGHR